VERTLIVVIVEKRGHEQFQLPSDGSRRGLPDAAQAEGLASGGGDLAWFVLDAVSQMDLEPFYAATEPAVGGMRGPMSLA